MFKKLIIRLAKAAGVTAADLDTADTEEEIKYLLGAGNDNGTLEENEMEMIQNIFDFKDTLAGDICTHRTDIVALPIDAGFEEVVKLVTEEKYSRIPVYRENIDDVVGILHVKDLVRCLAERVLEGEKTGFDLPSLLREPFFVPFSKKTDELFEAMQKAKNHMAIIIDEYGGTAGIVTMEDLLEEIVGNIFDEYDQEEKEDIESLGEDTFLISGTAPISDVAEQLEIPLPEDEYETIGGYLIGLLGRIPSEGEHPQVEIDGYLFQVVHIEEKRIEEIRVTRLPQPVETAVYEK